MNANDVLNAIARQFIAAKTNIRTTSVGFLFAFGFLGLQLRQNKTITLSDIEIATAIAAIGTVAKDATKSGVPPHDVIGKDGI